MKKLILITFAAVVAMISCSKQVDSFVPQPEVAFQVFRYKGATKADKPEDYKANHASIPFGAYAWYKGVKESNDTVFMVNQPVAYNPEKNAWAPQGTTYYWPKSGSLDFICYSPYTEDGTDAPLPTITENGISYSGWNVSEHPDVDIMYADKVSGLTSNSNTYYYNGVPILFHHALAKVSFNIKQSYMSVTADTGDTTSWVITVTSVVLTGMLTSGSLDLTLNPDGTWNKPTVWDSTDGTRQDLDLLSEDIVLDGTNQDLLSDLMILPQNLNEGQKVIITVTIETYRDNGDGQGPQLVLTETDIPIEALLSGGSLANIGTNQNITYTFNITPSLGTGTGTDSDNDGIEDMIPTTVYFDPAVSEWENITVDAGINI